MSKPRSDAKLLNLPDDRREQLCGWLIGGMGYETARAAIAREWDLSTSIGALKNFWDEECAPRVLARRARCAGIAQQVVEQSVGSAAKIDAALTASLKQRAFELLIDPATDPSALAQVVGTAMSLKAIEARDADRELKREALGLDRERLEIETCKKFLLWFRDANAREIAEGKGSNAEKIAALRARMFADVDAAVARGSAGQEVAR